MMLRRNAAGWTLRSGHRSDTRRSVVFVACLVRDFLEETGRLPAHPLRSQWAGRRSDAEMWSARKFLPEPAMPALAGAAGLVDAPNKAPIRLPSNSCAATEPH